MTDFDLTQYLAQRGTLVDRHLEAVLPRTEGLRHRLVEAMRYSLLSPGKRLRPVLCLAGAEAVGGDLETALPAAAALEMIHAYSLIHDDLPAMDDDDLRRGRPTNHKVFGEGLAVLAGDGLLTLAFGHLAEAGCRNLPPRRVLEATVLLARAAGHLGMVGGQAVDLELEGQTPSEEIIRYVHAHKTGALIAAAVAAGAVLGGGDQEQVRAMDTYGRRLGLAFQIGDDILDIEGETAVLGKKIGADQARGKATYPRIVGLSQARLAVDELVGQALAALGNFGPAATPLRAIAEYIPNRKK